MAITNIQKTTLKDFRAGRQTAKNLTNMVPESCLVAQDVMFLGDGVIRKRKGYTKVLGTGSSIQRIFDFQRQSDLKQWLVLNYGTNLAFTKNDGSAGLTVLSTTESSTKGFAFSQSPFGLYMSNGVNAYAEYNTGGTTESLWSFGIQAPVAPPTISQTTGTLTLTQGRTYSFCYVSKWTDSTGVAHFHIGPPSPLSANTGPFTSKVVNVGALVASTNPRVTHIWVFGTTDLGAGQSGNLIFVGEVTNGTTTFGDTLTVAQLDTTRVLPISNLPPPAYNWSVDYQGRIVIMGIPSDPAALYCSGLSEVDLGIPQECFPAEVRFTVPGKVKQISGGCTFGGVLMVGTPSMWFRITGADANTFQKDDDIIEPGPCGFQAVDIVQNQMIWLGPDKKLWGWDGSNTPVELSAKLAQPQPGLRSMGDISDAQLPNAIVRVFNFGRYHLIAVGVSTDGAGGVNWLQVYDASNLLGATGYKTMLSDGSLVGLSESDFNLTHRMTAFTSLEVVNTKYLFMGDGSGNVYRWPDGPLCDAGVSTITNLALTSNVVTVTAANTYQVGGIVKLAGLTTSTFLNGVSLTVASASATQFTANFTHANVVTHAETGTATGNLMTPIWGSVWLDHGMPGVIKRYMWTDILTDRTDAITAFGISAVVGDGINMNTTATAMPIQARPSGYAVDVTGARANMLSQAGTSVGEFSRVLINFPTDTLDASVHNIDISVIPLAVTNP